MTLENTKGPSSTCSIFPKVKINFLAILNNYQTSYVKTADEFNHILLNYCQAEEKFRPLIKSCLDDFAANAEKIDSTKDSEFIVEELKTGYHPPEDIPFEGES